MKNKRAFFTSFVSVSANSENVAKLICDCFCEDLQIENFEEFAGENDLASDLFEYNCAFLVDGYTKDDGSIDYERFELALTNANNELLKSEAWEFNIAYTAMPIDKNGTELIVEVGQMLTHKENAKLSDCKVETMYYNERFATFWAKHEAMQQEVSEMIQGEIECGYRSFDYNTQVADLCNGMHVTEEQLLELYPLLKDY